MAIVHLLLFAEGYRAGCTGRQGENSADSKESGVLPDKLLPEELWARHGASIVSIPSLDRKKHFQIFPTNPDLQAIN